MENVEVQSFNLIKHTNDLPKRRTVSLQRNIEEGREKGAKNRSRTRRKADPITSPYYRVHRNPSTPG